MLAGLSAASAQVVYGDAPADVVERVKKLAQLIHKYRSEQHGVSYSPFHWALPEFRDVEQAKAAGFYLDPAFLAALERLGFAVAPETRAEEGWRQYVALDGSFTVEVEGWGTHCMVSVSRRPQACGPFEFTQELRRRRTIDKKSNPWFVVWQPTKLKIRMDRWGGGVGPLHFRYLSLTVVQGAPAEEKKLRWSIRPDPIAPLLARLKSEAGRALAVEYEGDNFHGASPERVWTTGGCGVFAIAAARVLGHKHVLVFTDTSGVSYEHMMVEIDHTRALDADGIDTVQNLYARYSEGAPYRQQRLTVQEAARLLSRRSRAFAPRLARLLRGEKP